MPKFQDSRTAAPSGTRYRYDAEYEEMKDSASWTALVHMPGLKPLRLSGSANFNSLDTPAFSAVAKSVRTRVESHIAQNL